MIQQSLNAASIYEVQMEEEREATQKLMSSVASVVPSLHEGQGPIDGQSNSLSR